LFGSYTISCIRSEIFSFKAIKHGLFLRIFRVLHTVQSSVFKVLISVLLPQQQLLYDIMAAYFCQPLFSFSSKLSHRSPMGFGRNFAAFFSGELYHTKTGDKCQQLFSFF